MMMLLLVSLTALAGPKQTPISATPGLLVQPRASAAMGGEVSAQLELQRVRPLLKGEISEIATSYFVQAELVGAPRLLDAFIAIEANDWLTIKSGRFLVPVSRAQLTPVPKLQFQGFSASTNAQRYGRDVGAQLGATALRRRLTFTVGLFQGATTQVSAPRPMAFARVGLGVFGDVALDETEALGRLDRAPGLSVAAGAAVGAQVRASDERVVDSQTLSGDLAYRVWRLRFQAEAWVRAWGDGQKGAGGYLQGSIRVGEPVELALRVDRLQQRANLTSIDCLANWYVHGNNLRIGLMYTLRAPQGDARSHVLAVQQQLWF